MLRKIDTLVVDKTGTLTEGKPKLVSITTAADWNEDELLRLAASLERASEHPLAAAIVRGAQELGIELSKVDQFESLTGRGVRGQIEDQHAGRGRTVALGNRTLLNELKIETGDLAEKAESTAGRRSNRHVRGR